MLLRIIKCGINMKKVLKIVGFGLLGIIGLVGLVVAIFAITGGFSKKPVQISNLVVNVNNVEANEVLVDSDPIVLINYAPGNATALTLDVSVRSGSKEVLSSIPATVQAGRAFTLNLAKDDKGNNIGGEVELLFQNDNKLVRTSLKLMVDVTLTDNSLYFTSDLTPSAEGVYKLSVSPSNTSNLTLQSTITRALNPSTGLVGDNTGGFVTPELKDMRNKKMYYTIVDDKGNQTLQLSSQGITEVDGTNGKAYNFNFAAINGSTGTTITAYVHRTYALARAFNDSWFSGIMAGGEFTGLTAYNAFINGNLSNFTTTDEARAFFEAHTREITQNIDGQEITQNLVVLDQDTVALQQSLRYVFVTASAKFIISDVQISQITTKSQVGLTVLDDTFVVDTANINDKFGVSIEPLTGSDVDREILLNSVKDLNIGTYVKYGEEQPADVVFDYDAFGNIVGPMVDGHLQYVYVVDTWYEYNTTYASVTKNSNGATTWKLTPYYPNYNAGTKIASLPNVYLIYYIDNVDSDANITYKFATSELSVRYNPVVMNFDDISTRNIVLVNKGTQTAVEKLPDKYKLNSTSISSSNIHFQGGVQPEYNKLMWFVASASNNSIIEVFDTNDQYLSNIDGTLLSVTVGDVTYDKWQYLGDDERVALNALNANATYANLATAQGAKVFAMMMATDIDGNVLTRQIDLGEGNFVNTKIVSKVIEKPINVNVTYQLTGADELSIYTPIDGGYVKYEPTTLDEDNNVVNNTIDYIVNNEFVIYLSSLNYVDGAFQDNNNLKIGLENYYNNLLTNYTDYVKYNDGKNAVQYRGIEFVDNNVIAITLYAQDTTGVFDIMINRNINNSSLEPVSDSTQKITLFNMRIIEAAANV